MPKRRQTPKSAVGNYVKFGADALRKFRASYPASGIPSDLPWIAFQYDDRGDLVDIVTPRGFDSADFDGAGLSALADDGKRHAGFSSNPRKRSRTRRARRNPGSRKLAILESKGKGKRRFVVAELVGSTAGGGPIYMRVVPQVGYLTHEVAIAELERERAKDGGKNPRRRARTVRQIRGRVRGVNRRRAQRNPLQSESGAWKAVMQYAKRIEKNAGDAADIQDARNIMTIAAEMAVQAARGFHRNPTLAIVGAANPPGRLLGEVVGDVKYHRTVGKHPGYYRHDFKGRSRACIYAMPDGSLRIIGKGR